MQQRQQRHHHQCLGENLEIMLVTELILEQKLSHFLLRDVRREQRVREEEAIARARHVPLEEDHARAREARGVMMMKQ